MSIDLLTVVFLNMILYIVCTLFIVQLWWQNRRRFDGMGFWVLNYLLQSVSMVMFVFRSTLPELLSILSANTLVMAGIIAGYIGLERFAGKKSPQIHNYVLFFIFVFINTYFTVIHPDITVRSLNVSTGLLIVCFQCSWLLIRRVRPELRSNTLWPGIVFACYCLISLAMIAGNLITTRPGDDFFQSARFIKIMFVFYQILFILLTYSFTMMVNKRLLQELGYQEEKFAKAFRSAPYSITISKVSDGTIIDVNERFCEIMGYNRDEVVGKKSDDLNIWVNNQDRELVKKYFNESRRVRGLDCQFRNKKGEFITGLYSAEIIMLNGEMCVYSSTGDITERKIAENRIRNLLLEKELLLKEVHHRLKNNMNTLSSLLSLQAEMSENKSVAAALNDARSRIHSMTVLYDKLYQSEGFNDINAGEYIPVLIEEIMSNFPNRRFVGLAMNIDDFMLDTNKLQPLGIIINELVTNIMKYAFTGVAGGVIKISAAEKDNIVQIVIRDNGGGMPESIDFNNSTGFGLMLVGMLTRQLGGAIRIERNNGTGIILEFEK